MDISAIEARGLFSPPNGNEPQLLPDRWRNSPDEPIRTDLPELTDEELNALGWKGPISRSYREVDGEKYYYEWNRETREYIERELVMPDYRHFWNLLLNTNVYAKIKLISSQSLAANTLTTEFIALISDAKRGEPDVGKIQQAITEITSNISFTAEEFAEMQRVFTDSNMFKLYTLPLQ